MLYIPNTKPFPLAVGADGIAINSDGSLLYYCPLSSRRLHGLNIAALIDPALPDEKVPETIKNLGEKGGASDGLESDAKGRVYLLTMNTMSFAESCLTGSMKPLPMTRKCSGQIHSPSPKTGISISRQIRYTDRRVHTGTK